MAFRHNSKMADREPRWGGVDKTKLPVAAYADHGEPGKKSTWKFPHHWIKDGGELNDDGIFTTGTMYLHKGGLNAAWAAAQGARTGRKAPQATIDHLQVHRKALGLDKGMSAEDLAVLMDPGKSTISKHAIRHRRLQENYLDSKQDSPGAKNGTIEGYASQFDVVDHQREVVRRGAFTKTIAEQDGKIVLSAKHFARGGDLEHAVATIVEMREDDYGLWFKANWHDDEASQRIREKVKKLRGDGVKVYTSIGYIPVKWGFIKSENDAMTLVELTEIALKEITLTLNPANEGAVVLDAKDGADNDDGGSSPADDGRAQEEPPVTEGSADATAQSQGGSDAGDPPAARTTDAEADSHSADAKVIGAKAQTVKIREKIEELKA